jgi:hypothetical protein
MTIVDARARELQASLLISTGSGLKAAVLQRPLHPYVHRTSSNTRP